jgi:anti-sigma-K factor RskA
MKYADPHLRSILAGEYVLGTMKPRVRARFERLMRYDADLVHLTGEWADRLTAVDSSVTPEPIPVRVWRAIEARTAPQRSASQGWRSPSLWRWTTAAASVAVLVLLVVLGMRNESPSLAPHVVAVLADKDGTPGWIVSAARGQESFAVEAVHAQAIDAQHAFELWVVADNKPLPLGVIPGAAQSRATIPAGAVPKNGVAFAVSLEPPGGSPTGSPTGPVLYQGRILEN